MVNGRWSLMARAGVIALLLVAGCGKQQDRAALQEGLRALDAGRYSQSVRLFQKAVRDNVSRADNALAYNGLGIVYWRMQQKDNAIRAFENAARMDPRLMEPVYNLGALQFESGNEADAVICFEKAALIVSHETRALEFLSSIYQKRRQWKESRRVLTTARSRAPRSHSVLTALALLELQTNNVETAVALLQEALEHDAQYPPAIFNLAVANQRRTNNLDQVRVLYKDFLNIVPEGSYADKARQALKNLPESEPSPSAAVPPSVATSPAPASVSEKKQDVRPAADLKPEPVTVAVLTADDLLNNARKLERAGRRAAAVNNYLKAAREAERTGNGSLRSQALHDAEVLCVDDSRANYEVGQYYAEHKQNDQAMVYLKKAVSKDPQGFEAQFALAKVAVELEEFDTARVSVKQADKARPEQADALWGLAQLCDRNAALQDLAPPVYVRFEKMYPTDPRVPAAQDRLKALQPGLPRPAENVPGPAADTNRNASSSWWGWLTR